LQLVHGHSHPEVRSPSTPLALQACARAGVLAPADRDALMAGFHFLRRVESRLRLVRDRPMSHLPRGGRQLLLLARRLGYAGARAGQDLLEEYERATAAVRAAYLRVLGHEAA
jgi:glutamate-ammonia-ligase adenylyltransferase